MASKSARKPDRWYYFAYGSNMCLKQMAERCPSSLFMGKGRIDGFRWQINQRGVANIVECEGEYVEGLIYQIDAKEKRQLDRSEGVALGFYNDDYLHTIFSSLPHRGIKTFHVAKELEMGNQADPKQKEYQPLAPVARNNSIRESTLVDQSSSRRVASRDPRQEGLEMIEALVYVSSEYREDGYIRSEYIRRMERAIADGRKMGLSDRFLNHIDRTIHREIPPRRHNDAVQTRDGPYERARNDVASREQFESLERNRQRQVQPERVSTISPSYARYARVVTIRPRYQDFHDLDGELRYEDERPYQPTHNAGRHSRTGERNGDRSPRRARQSRGRDEQDTTGLFARITSRYHVGRHPERVIRYHRRSSSTPY